VLSDIPIGVLTLAVLFDLIDVLVADVDLRQATDIAIGVGVLAMIGAAISGSADYSDADDDARTVATVHATVMVIALVIFIAVLGLRLMDPAADPNLTLALTIVGYLVLALGGWVGGELVFTLGNMVYRHAWRFYGEPKWQKLDLTDIPEGQPTAAKAGTQSVVVVRQGSDVYALHSVCAHAGGPLAEGRLVDGCVECPWHFSRFELKTGRRKAGPTTFDQPRYEVRAADGGGWELRRVGGTNGQNF
jgi:nitrite reductase/ring-hydroxylating ferredoxin subunit/uncharacterized membrane protein